jgi:hypothetical protein
LGQTCPKPLSDITALFKKGNHMKRKNFICLLMLNLIALNLLTFTENVWAQAISQVISGAPSGRADLYRIRCGLGTTKLRLCVQLTGGPTFPPLPLIYAQFAREGTAPSGAMVATTASCPASAIGGIVYTPLGVSVPGDYNISVTSNLFSGIATYDLIFRCENSGGMETSLLGYEVVGGGSIPELPGNVVLTPKIDLLIDR